MTAEIEILDPQPNSSWFKKGEPRPEGAGRRPGSVNGTTRILKEAAILAAELEGRDGNGQDGLVGFFRRVANEDIRSFAAILGRIIPLQAENKGDVRVEVTYDTIDQVREELEACGISIDMVKKALHQPFEDFSE